MTSIIDQMKAVQDRNIKKLEKIPGWPGITLYIKTLSANDVFKYQKIREDKNKDWKPYLLMLSVCDEAGNSELSEKDLGWLSTKSIKAINYIIDQVNDMILVTDEDMEDRVKNS